MIAALGAVRPLVGALIAMAVVALLEGGWIPSVEITGDRLAFYAGLGFLAGFSERFAQDMLVGSARQISRQLDRSPQSQPTSSAPALEPAESAPAS